MGVGSCLFQCPARRVPRSVDSHCPNLRNPHIRMCFEAKGEDRNTNKEYTHYSYHLENKETFEPKSQQFASFPELLWPRKKNKARRIVTIFLVSFSATKINSQRHNRLRIQTFWPVPRPSVSLYPGQVCLELSVSLASLYAEMWINISSFYKNPN